MRHRRHKEEILGRRVSVPRPYTVPLPDLETLRAFSRANWRHKLRAKDRCDALLATPPERLRERVLKHRKTYVSYPVVDELLRRARQAVFTDALHARNMAKIALFIADEMVPGKLHLGTPAMCRDAKARCYAYLGNCYRVLCQWDDAERELRKATDLLWLGTGDLQVHAEVLRFQGSLLREQRRFDQALDVLREAASIYQALKEPHMEGLVLLKVAETHRQNGHPREALPVHIRACDLVDEHREPMAAAAAWNNLMRIYSDAGEFESAFSVLQGASSVYDLCPKDSSVHVVRNWTTGCILAGLGRNDEALEHLKAARSGFEARQNPLDCALVQLDIVRLLFKQGKQDALTEAASSLSEALATESLKWDVEYALRLLVEAAVQRRLEEQLIEEAVGAIQRQLRLPRPVSPKTTTVAGAWDTFPEG
jgi:tetratricopeptide (TPR) repeat protein